MEAERFSEGRIRRGGIKPKPDTPKPEVVVKPQASLPPRLPIENAEIAARKADENKKTVKGPVSVTGIWLRKEGKDRIVVLAEVDGKWRTLMTETWPLDGEGEFSHIIEPSGIRKAPKDEITEREPDGNPAST